MENRHGLAAFGLLATGLLVALGTFWSYQRGGLDFLVFHEAWRLVLSGKTELVYSVSPDRFLYAPGFALVFAPLGAIPREIALGLWCLLKALALGAVIAKLARALRVPAGIAALGAVFVARPLLIDLQYGQVNLLIACVATWALLRHFEREPGGRWDFIAWFLLAFAALAKLFPLPLLLVPWFFSSGIRPERIRLERAGSVLGFLLIVFLPFFARGWSGGLALYSGWYDALLARGTPIESHNQSFISLLRHLFSGDPTPVLAQGMRTVDVGVAWLSPQAIGLLSTAWSIAIAGLALGWIISGPFQSPMRWVAIAVGVLILPSHLVWKPYFVMALPAAALAIREALVSRELWKKLFVGAIFVAMNFTSLDFLGLDLASRFEASAFLLVLHVALLAFVRFAQTEQQDLRRMSESHEN